MSIQIKIEQEMDIKNTEFTEKFLNGEAKLINAVPYTITEYIRCVGQQIENIFGRWRLAYARCPKCRKYITIYKDEIRANGQTKAKKCLCGFRHGLILKNW